MFKTIFLCYTNIIAHANIEKLLLKVLVSKQIEILKNPVTSSVKKVSFKSYKRIFIGIIKKPESESFIGCRTFTNFHP